MSELQIRELHTIDQMHEANAVLSRVWQSDPDRPQVEPSLMVALAHAGDYVIGGYAGDRMIAASVGFFTVPAQAALHSHITGVLAEYAGSGTGAALKRFQKSWCLERGLRAVVWTFDPLVRRNAYFNIAKTGTSVDEYLVDVYGAMPDGVNAGQPSDRMLARWELLADPPPVPSAADYAPVVAVGTDDEPVLSNGSADQAEMGRDNLNQGDAGQVAVAIPPDIEVLRSQNPQLSRTWRQVVRDAVEPRLRVGWRVAGFDRHAGYLLTRNHGGDR